ncbi:hypothetical protein PhCBS80983_g05096 [Powellomyces hirtus]|uniref:N-acetyltransferase domain-containing protein n=1 Tax=Powellomyces hirtus TaxID=109895 RepID=A0A507DW06_9FUNG|nr:hypothetical protein PhCBS80983_g05096 [Powellomyces hirtus]
MDLVIEEKLTGVVIGKMGLYKLPEIGFILHPAYWGKGYASEALTLMLKVIWDLRPELSHIDADVDPRNWRSLRLLKRFGFVEIGRREKTFETHLGWCDSVDLRLTRPMMK